VRAKRTLGLLAAVAFVGGVCAAPAGSAIAAPSAPSVASAKAQAKALTAQVAALQTQVEVATEKYDAVTEQLGEVVNSYLDAQQQLGSLNDNAALQRQENVQRIQALYKAGGQLGLFAQILDGGDINDVISRYVAVNHVLAADASAITTSSDQVVAATAAAQKLNALADQRSTLESQVQLARAQIVGLLEERQGQLESANALVRTLVAQQQEQAAAAAAAAAAATLGTDPAAPTTLPPGTPSEIVTAVAAARSALGDPYQWGGTGPATWDCSGLTQWAYAQAGITLPRTASEQWSASGTHPAVDALLPGDLLFWATNPADPASIHHVALYIGGGYMIEAPHTGAFVHIVPVYLDGFFGATRVVASGATRVVDTGTTTVVTAGSFSRS
jgi:peptidoglycan DL-endopeptidase CwlO